MTRCPSTCRSFILLTAVAAAAFSAFATQVAQPFWVSDRSFMTRCPSTCRSFILLAAAAAAAASAFATQLVYALALSLRALTRSCPSLRKASTFASCSWSSPQV